MVFEKYNLGSRTALITGEAGLLGQEHAAALLEAGANVILTDISKDQLALAENRLLKSYQSELITSMIMDVSSSENVNNVSEKLSNQNIRVDILINNAAIDPKVDKKKGLKENSRIENLSLDQWNLELAVGLTGAFICSQVFGSKMASDKKGGVILNISSDLSVFSPDQRIYFNKGLSNEMQPVKPVTYSVIKTGLIGLTRYLATYWSKDNVRCNALSPGGVFNNQDEIFLEKLTNLIPLNRMAAVDEYRSAVQFLCSDASSYMNGQNMVIDGGRSVW